MPDEIDAAIRVFAASLAADRTVPCDVLRVASEAGPEPPRHFVGYGGAGVFGRIPHYTENRFIKYYKGVRGQIFGDMGPFFVGAVLASVERSAKRVVRPEGSWRVEVGGREVARRPYQALILANGYLGPDMPFARDLPVSSGDFHLFGLRDLGTLRLPGQFRRAWDASIARDPDRWGFETYRVTERLRLALDSGREFPVNVDGSTMVCEGAATFRIVDTIRFIAAPDREGDGSPA
jgi:diacylglycerol kinase family enzyme